MIVKEHQDLAKAGGRAVTCSGADSTSDLETDR